MRFFIAALILLASQPGWALYKCAGTGGAVSFQEMPCAGAQAQTAVREQYQPDKLGTAAPPPSLVETSASLENERLQRGTEYAIRDKRAQIQNHQARCDAQVRDIAANRLGWNNNLAGATRSQAEATAASAHATNCSTQSRQLEAEMQDLQRQCASQKCIPTRAFN